MSVFLICHQLNMNQLEWIFYFAMRGYFYCTPYRNRTMHMAENRGENKPQMCHCWSEVCLFYTDSNKIWILWDIESVEVEIVSSFMFPMVYFGCWIFRSVGYLFVCSAWQKQRNGEIITIRIWHWEEGLDSWFLWDEKWNLLVLMCGVVQPNIFVFFHYLTPSENLNLTFLLAL